MTLIIKNVEPRFLATFKAFSKCFNAKVEAKKSKSEIAAEWIKEDEQFIKDCKAGKAKHYKADKEIAQKWEKEVKEAMRDYKAGKLKVYKSAKEMHEDILKNG